MDNPAPSAPGETLPLLERFKYPIFIMIALALIAGIAVLMWQRPEPATISVLPPEPTPVPSVTPTPTATATPGPYVVYVTGAVATPEAVVTLGYGSRVLDALMAAGGPLENANLERVNLAQILEDGDHVHVPTHATSGETTTAPRVQIVTATPGNYTVYVVGEIVTGETLLTLPAGSRVEDAISAAGGATDNADLAQINLSQLLDDGDYIYVPPRTGDTIRTPTPNHPRLIHVNTATREELETLPGIGPKLAQAIIDYRTENGPFQSMEELDDVPGIGPATLNTLRELIVID